MFQSQKTLFLNWASFPDFRCTTSACSPHFRGAAINILTDGNMLKRSSYRELFISSVFSFFFFVIDFFFSSLQLVWMLDEGETAIVYLWNIYEPGKAICVASERWWRAGLERNARGRGRRGEEEKIGCLGKKGDVTPTPASSKIRVFSSRLLIRAAVYPPSPSPHQPPQL